MHNLHFSLWHCSYLAPVKDQNTFFPPMLKGAPVFVSVWDVRMFALSCSAMLFNDPKYLSKNRLIGTHFAEFIQNNMSDREVNEEEVSYVLFFYFLLLLYLHIVIKKNIPVHIVWQCIHDFVILVLVVIQSEGRKKKRTMQVRKLPYLSFFLLMQQRVCYWLFNFFLMSPISIFFCPRWLKAQAKVRFLALL